jgi:hypothetical protein
MQNGMTRTVFALQVQYKEVYMRFIFFSALWIMVLGGALHAADTSQPQPVQPAPLQPPQLSTEVPQTNQTRCMQLIYNRYVTRGFSPQASWNNAIRDCGAGGIDVSCLDAAYKHYVSMGQNDNQAYNNARRDCRSLIPR